MQTERTSVLTVGGGLVGLSAAVFLAFRGVPTILLERRAGSSPHPRARGFTTRTMEIFRAVGLGEAIPQIPSGVGRPRRIKVESLAGNWAKEEVAWTPAGAATGAPADPLAEYSICTAAAIAQDELEPILRTRAIELGADVRLSAAMESFVQDDAGVTALVRTRGGEGYSVAARYMIAADGSASPIRQALGIGRDGRGYIQTIQSVMFRASLGQYLVSGISQFEIDQPGLKGMLGGGRDGRWLLMISDGRERDDAELRAAVLQAIGRADVHVEIISTGRWDAAGLIADRFASGRIFLAGDAAHALPPARGGFGANTGIEDVHNLAWKLDAVLAGTSSPPLLGTYDAERRPIAWLRHGQIFNRPDYAAVARPPDKEVPLIGDIAMELGQLYRSAAVLGAGADLLPALPPDQWNGQPGTRAPHVWVAHDGARVSTLDLVQPDWVLLTEDERWRAAATETARRMNRRLRSVVVGGPVAAKPQAQPPLDVAIERIVADPAAKAVLDAVLPQVSGHADYQRFKSMSLRTLRSLARDEISDADLARAAAALAPVFTRAVAPEPVDPAAFGKAFGISKSGASLVRPDGYVAWRSRDMPATATAELEAALISVTAARS